jgi:hypothetical protein
MSVIKLKLFNTAGPCDPVDHYMLPALPRLPDVQYLIDTKQYFVLHAPRQSGKSTSITAFADKINNEERFYALYCSLQIVRDFIDPDRGMAAILKKLEIDMNGSEVKALREVWDSLPEIEFNSATVILETLRTICKKLDKELVIFFDEADCLADEILISFLSQLRDGYEKRGKKQTPFARSIALIGMRNIRDYKNRIRPDRKTMGSASPFNVIKKALTMANFTKDEIKILYGQHTEATSQVFEEEAIERAWYWSEGQPWLSNALAYEAVVEILLNNYSQPVTGQHIDQAADNLMNRRDTHIDSLLDRLSELRVSSVIESVIAGENLRYGLVDDDVQYCLDLGLVKEFWAEEKDDMPDTQPDKILIEHPMGNQAKNPENVFLRPANPIYNNFINIDYYSRLLKYLPEDRSKWIDGDSIKISQLLKDFQDDWRKTAEYDFKGLTVRETIPQVLLQFYLKKAVNNGGEVDRELSVGRGRADICVKYKGHIYPLELKMDRGKLSMRLSLRQIRRYMDILGVKEGWLVIFDGRPIDPKVDDTTKIWDTRIYWDTKSLL